MSYAAKFLWLIDESDALDLLILPPNSGVELTHLCHAHLLEVNGRFVTQRRVDPVFVVGNLHPRKNAASFRFYPKAMDQINMLPCQFVDSRIQRKIIAGKTRSKKLKRYAKNGSQ